MNNEYEHMEEKTQEGVCFQWDESHEDIVDMNVEAGIKIVELPSNIQNIDFMSVDVEGLDLEVLESNSITIGYTFDSDYWQHGYAIESMRALLLELKNRYNFKIVFAHVYDDNIRSIRLLKNLGFVQYETSKIMGDIGFKLRL